MTSLELGIWALVVLAVLIYFRLGRLNALSEVAPSYKAPAQILEKLEEISRQLDARNIGTRHHQP